MAFINTALNLLLFIALIMFARDWLTSLRSDVAATRADVVRATKELVEARVDVNQANLEATQQSTEDLQNMAVVLRELRELRGELKLLAKHDLAMGEMVKLLVQGRLQELATLRANQNEGPSGDQG